LFLQVFMGMIAATALFLAAAIRERDPRGAGGATPFWAIVSHDLKNPLASDLAGHAQMLRRQAAQRRRRRAAWWGRSSARPTGWRSW